MSPDFSGGDFAMMRRACVRDEKVAKEGYNSDQLHNSLGDLPCEKFLGEVETPEPSTSEL